MQNDKQSNMERIIMTLLGSYTSDAHVSLRKFINKYGKCLVDIIATSGDKTGTVSISTNNEKDFSINHLKHPHLYTILLKPHGGGRYDIGASTLQGNSFVSHVRLALPSLPVSKTSRGLTLAREFCDSEQVYQGNPKRDVLINQFCRIYENHVEHTRAELTIEYMESLGLMDDHPE